MRTDAQFNKALVKLYVAAEVAWIILAAIVLLLSTGCAVNEKETRQVPLPPLPKSTRVEAAASITQGQAIEPPRKRLIWNKVDTHPDTVTEFWATEDFTNWYFFAESKEPTLDIVADKPRLFFKYRNRLYNQYSDWAK